MFKKPRSYQLSPRLGLGVGRTTTKTHYLKYASGIFILAAVGLSVNAFSLLLNKNSIEDTAQATPQVLGAQDTRSNPEPTSPRFETYQVKKSDTLFNIAQKFNISWTTLATLNNLESPFTVSPGQQLKVPKP